MRTRSVGSVGVGRGRGIGLGLRRGAGALPCLLLFVGALSGCGPKAGALKPGGPSLYDKLGGREAIAAVVADLVESVKTDERIRGRFPATTDWDGFRAKLTEQLCAAAGGPCTYAGKDMRSAHQGMGISEPEFNAVVDDLKKTLDKLRVGEPEQTELVSLLAPMKKDIVAPPSS